MIELVTFTGVDAGTDFVELRELAEQYPLAEFGVLVGTRTGEEDFGIFPPIGVVTALGELEVRSALHLCGRWAQAVSGEMSPVGIGEFANVGLLSYIYGVSKSFDSVQINLHGDELGSQDIEVRGAAVGTFADHTEAARVILQHRGQRWTDVPVVHPKVEYLFDLSEGGGWEYFDYWPEPATDGRRMGYAGGLGPHNIRRALEFADSYPEARLWFDMEGRIRTDERFDLAKVRSVCEQVWGQP